MTLGRLAPLATLAVFAAASVVLVQTGSFGLSMAVFAAALPPMVVSGLSAERQDQPVGALLRQRAETGRRA